jgi:homoserine O-acetyltransferase
MEYFHYTQPVTLESGGILPEITVAYTTYGKLNADKSNVVWICHALTANADVADWWSGVVGTNHVINPEKYFIICANILGSCYGTTGPLSIDPLTGKPYYHSFPFISIRDMVQVHILLRKHLQIESIYLLIGGSMGGYQALEWSFIENNLIRNIFLLATSATESAWGIAIHTAQRLSIEADGSWLSNTNSAGENGLKAARAIGMLTYRNYNIMVQMQSDDDMEKTIGFKAESYIQHQGNKLVSRFNAYSYWLLTRAMDSHHIARGRGGNVLSILQNMRQPTLIIGVNSDILCPLTEQQTLAVTMPSATLVTIDSNYGHDGFMVESEAISSHLADWLYSLVK